MQLGDLGADLGSAAEADVRRLQRALKKRNVHDVELVARHLALKLRRAAPSFAGGSSGGVESGMGAAGEMQVQPSDADQRFDQLALELEQLIEEHAHNISSVEGVVSDAMGQAEQAPWRTEATELARRVRASAEGLPRIADTTSTGEEAALAREHAESMADALQDLSLRDALVSGRDAVSALGRARRAQDSSGGGIVSNPRALDDAVDVISRALRWVMERQRDMESAAAERAQETLQQAASREHALADKSDHIASEGNGGEVRFPERVIDALRGAYTRMRDATRMLRARRAEKALALQRRAQEMLEQARTGRTTESGDTGRRGANELSGVDAKGMRTDRMIEPNHPQDTAEFRQRVLDGLGQPKAERLAPAVRRYAEELLK